MKNLLYIGNKLNNLQTNTTSIDTLGQLFEEESYSVKYASTINNPFLRLLDMSWRTLWFGKKMDFVIIDTYSTLNFYYALITSQLCRMLNVKYIPILRGGNLPSRLKHSTKLSELVFKNAQVNVAPSLYLKDSFESYGYQNVVYIPNTIRLENYPYHKKTFDNPRLLWVRSFSEIYNPTLAVEVLHELRQRGYEASLCMVGPDTDGSLADVKAMVEALQLPVTFTGKLTKEAWIKISNNYNVFINTTDFDNTPVSVIESMALGLPVVSTNVGGMPYLIANGVDGSLVAKNNKIAMTDAIELLFEDISRTEEMVVKAREKVEQFDWGKVGVLWDELLTRASVPFR